MTTLLKNKGVYWHELSQAERVEIDQQFPKIYSDNNLKRYRFRKALHGKWIITNAMSVPLINKEMRL